MVRRTSLVAVGALLAGGALVMPSSLAAKDAAVKKAGPPAAKVGFRTVQANLRSPNTRAQFRSDMRVVRSLHPDFATLNEVGKRSAGDLTPAGYGMFRTPGFYKGANAVIWRTDRWTKIDSGMATIDNKRGVPKGKKVQLGLRYANWVTLKSRTGRVISVVATHFAPPVKQWPSQIPKEVRNLGNLVNTLATAGPVIAGGDLNVGYGSRAYPRSRFNTYNLVATYDLLHASPRGGTGDHHGNTIDFTLVRQDKNNFTPTGQFTTGLKSDHKALTTDWKFNSSVPVKHTGTRFRKHVVRNHPSGNKAARRAVLHLVHKAIVNAPPGSAIHLKTVALRDGSTIKALRKAKKRGVKVQIVQRVRKRSKAANNLRRLLGHNPPNGSWFVGCTSSRCHKASGRMAKTTVLVSRAGLTSAVRITSNRSLSANATNHPTVARVTNTLRAYNKSFDKFFALVGGY